QAVVAGERLLRVEHELREAAGLVDLDHAHAEMRRALVQRVLRYEGVIGLGGVVIPQLRQVVLAEVAIDAVLVTALAVRAEELLHGVRTAEVREARLMMSKVSEMRRSSPSSCGASKS